MANNEIDKSYLREPPFEHTKTLLERNATKKGDLPPLPHTVRPSARREEEEQLETKDSDTP